MLRTSALRRSFVHFIDIRGIRTSESVKALTRNSSLSMYSRASIYLLINYFLNRYTITVRVLYGILTRHKRWHGLDSSLSKWWQSLIHCLRRLDSIRNTLQEVRILIRQYIVGPHYTHASFCPLCVSFLIQTGSKWSKKIALLTCGGALSQYLRYNPRSCFSQWVWKVVSAASEFNPDKDNCCKSTPLCHCCSGL